LTANKTQLEDNSYIKSNNTNTNSNKFTTKKSISDLENKNFIEEIEDRVTFGCGGDEQLLDKELFNYIKNQSNNIALNNDRSFDNNQSNNSVIYNDQLKHNVIPKSFEMTNN